MQTTIISSCLRSCRPTRHVYQQLRTQSSSSSSRGQQQLDSHTLLATPTWSVRSLLPSSSSSSTTPQQPQITPSQLRHLLRLSALPPPASPAAESAMIATLESQLHFVRAIQQVETTGVEPLRSIRDETAAGLTEATIGMDQLNAVLEREEIRGHCRRPRRRRDVPVDAAEAENWDVLGTASQKAGRYFIVRSGKSEAATEKQDAQ